MLSSVLMICLLSTGVCLRWGDARPWRSLTHQAEPKTTSAPPAATTTSSIRLRQKGMCAFSTQSFSLLNVRFQVNGTHIIGAKISCIKSFRALARRTVVCRLMGASYSPEAQNIYEAMCWWVQRKQAEFMAPTLWATCCFCKINSTPVSKLLFENFKSLLIKEIASCYRLCKWGNISASENLFGLLLFTDYTWIACLSWQNWAKKIWQLFPIVE